MTAEGSNTTVSADELRRFVDRIQRPADRAAYVLDRLASCFGISCRYTSRAFALACRVIGTEYEVGKPQLQRAMFGDLQPLLSEVSADVSKVCGFVYWAAAENRPDQIKIGFSADPTHRALALSRMYRRPIRIVRCEPGTMLDEHLRHCRLSASRIAGEWFKADAARAA